MAGSIYEGEIRQLLNHGPTLQVPKKGQNLVSLSASLPANTFQPRLNATEVSDGDER
jgi:hypothetical protein